MYKNLLFSAFSRSATIPSVELGVPITLHEKRIFPLPIDVKNMRPIIRFAEKNPLKIKKGDGSRGTIPSKLL